MMATWIWYYRVICLIISSLPNNPYYKQIPMVRKPSGSIDIVRFRLETTSFYLQLLFHKRLSM